MFLPMCFEIFSNFQNLPSNPRQNFLNFGHDIFELIPPLPSFFASINLLDW